MFGHPARLYNVAKRTLFMFPRRLTGFEFDDIVRSWVLRTPRHGGGRPSYKALRDRPAGRTHHEMKPMLAFTTFTPRWLPRVCLTHGCFAFAHSISPEGGHGIGTAAGGRGEEVRGGIRAGLAVRRAGSVGAADAADCGGHDEVRRPRCCSKCGAMRCSAVHAVRLDCFGNISLVTDYKVACL